MSASQASDGSSGSVGWFKKLVSTSNSKIGKMESYVKKKLFNGRDDSLSAVEYIGTAVVMKKLKVLDLIDEVADVEDDTSEAIVGKHVSVQLVSAELLGPRKYAQNIYPNLGSNKKIHQLLLLIYMIHKNSCIMCVCIDYITLSNFFETHCRVPTGRFN